MLDCPCGSGRTFADCCEPYLDHVKEPPTAEALMRARYTAFARHRIEYITGTLHPARLAGHNEREVRDWSLQSEWLGLEILSVEGGGSEDTRGLVEFVARYKTKDENVEHRELAEFRKRDGKWLFYDGKVRGGEPIVRGDAKLGRNDPCSCGSGKKYKKCCGAGAG